MAISFPAPEAAAKHQLEDTTREPVVGDSLLTYTGDLIKRGYERVCSAIFDADGDCMRF